jgi:hypothetical protein
MISIEKATSVTIRVAARMGLSGRKREVMRNAERSRTWWDRPD